MPVVRGGRPAFVVRRVGSVASETTVSVSPTTIGQATPPDSRPPGTSHQAAGSRRTLDTCSSPAVLRASPRVGPEPPTSRRARAARERSPGRSTTQDAYASPLRIGRYRHRWPRRRSASRVRTPDRHKDLRTIATESVRALSIAAYVLARRFGCAVTRSRRSALSVIASSQADGPTACLRRNLRRHWYAARRRASSGRCSARVEARGVGTAHRSRFSLPHASRCNQHST